MDLAPLSDTKILTFHQHKFVDYYEFYKNNNAIYILSEGDSVAVYELEGNSFLILQKVIKEIIEQNNGDENNEL